jgi:hypothetical protein
LANFKKSNLTKSKKFVAKNKMCGFYKTKNAAKELLKFEKKMLSGAV